MHASTKKRIAREWLYLLGFLAFSIVVFIPIFIVLRGTYDLAGTYGYHWEKIFKLDGVAWLVTLSPYLLFQLTRSIVWAVRTARVKEEVGQARSKTTAN